MRWFNCPKAIKYFKFVLCMLGLWIVAGEAYAALFDVLPTDKSMQYLGIIFGGNVGSVTLGGGANPLLGRMFERFNFIIVMVGTTVITYIGAISVINTAREGEALGQKLGTWTILRSIIGLLLMIPTPGTGYSVIQVTVMWLVLNGIGAANSIWNVVLNQLATGTRAIGNIVINIPDAQLNTLAQQVLRSSTCMYSLAMMPGLKNTSAYGSPKLIVTLNPVMPSLGPDGRTATQITQSATVNVGYQGSPNNSLAGVCGTFTVSSVIQAGDRNNAMNQGSIAQRLSIKTNALLAMFNVYAPAGQLLAVTGAGAVSPSQGYTQLARDGYKAQIAGLSGGVQMQIGFLSPDLHRADPRYPRFAKLEFPLANLETFTDADKSIHIEEHNNSSETLSSNLNSNSNSDPYEEIALERPILLADAGDQTVGGAVSGAPNAAGQAVAPAFSGFNNANAQTGTMTTLNALKNAAVASPAAVYDAGRVVFSNQGLGQLGNTPTAMSNAGFNSTNFNNTNASQGMSTLGSALATPFVAAWGLKLRDTYGWSVDDYNAFIGKLQDSGMTPAQISVLAQNQYNQSTDDIKKYWNDTFGVDALEGDWKNKILNPAGGWAQSLQSSTAATSTVNFGKRFVGNVATAVWELGPQPITFSQQDINSMSILGWIHAGSYYAYMVQATPNNLDADAQALPTYSGIPVNTASDPQTKKPPPPGWNPGLSGLLSDTPNGQITTMNNGLKQADAFYAADSVSAPPALPGITAPGGSGNDIIDAILKPMESALQAPLISYIQQQMSGGATDDPLMGMATFGRQLMFTGELSLFAAMILAFAGSVGGSVTSCLSPFAWAINQILLQLFFMIFGIIVLFWGLGATLGVYTPLIPYLLFATTAFGWFTLVVEAITGAPVLALALIHPSKEELGKVMKGVITIASIFLRPSLMIFGFVLGANVLRACMAMINFGFMTAVQITAQPTLFSFIAVIGVYCGIAVTLVNYSFSLIYELPDKIFQWMGEQGGQGKGAQELMKGAESGASQASQQVQTAGKQIGSYAQSASKGGKGKDKDDDDDKGGGGKGKGGKGGKDGGGDGGGGGALPAPAPVPGGGAPGAPGLGAGGPKPPLVS